ncbi:flagellar assembly protein FliH [Pseudoalteromonas sp. SWXJ133]|uniref:FliH/SctL family protein n=1 Tax=unclassified Pseudoalteromonas TaxID=194690 RepID=UPI00140C5843|nr:MULTISPECIES: FliH/SctL family protein [unclassified Pseudoalteromonas]MBH0020061.1 flagellar assembly protein FliH [Pseudoalteromonas sp. SWXJ133]
MTETFRFPVLNKIEQQKNLHERLEAAERAGWQSGYEKGLEQGALDKQNNLEQQVETKVETSVNERLESEKKILVDHFNVIFEKTNNELLALSTDLKNDITQIITKLAEFVIDNELKIQPEIRLGLVEKAIELLSDRDVVTKIIFSSADKEWLDSAVLKNFAIPIQFDDELISGDVELIAEQQTHSFSFSQRLQSLLDTIIPEILRNDSDEQ